MYLVLVLLLVIAIVIVISNKYASAAIDSGDDFSHQSTQAMDNYDNYDNFDQTIMGLDIDIDKLQNSAIKEERNVSLPRTSTD